MSWLGIQRKIARLQRIFTEIRGSSGQTYVHHRVSQYREMWQAVAEDFGARFTDIADKVWEIELAGRKTRILNDILAFDDPVTLEIAGMKPVVYRMLGEKGLPVPEHLVFSLEEWPRAAELLAKHPHGVVVKPANGTSSGQGVTTHILTREEVRKAAILASLYGKELLVEPMIPGECYRLLVLDGQVIHAVCRRGPRLKGDGKTNIAGLIEAENDRRSRQGQPILNTDRDLMFTLVYQHLALDSVPAAGQVFLVRSVDEPDRKNIEVRTVYNEVVTETVGGDMKHRAVQAAAILGSRFVGVDFITTDGKATLEAGGGVINELNTTPGLHHHYDSQSERYPQSAPHILRAVLGLSD